MDRMLHEDSPECTDRCKSIKHGDIVTSVITRTRRCITDDQLCSYISYSCKNCENIRDSLGRTALHLAASCGRLNLVRWLIHKRHTNINVKDSESGLTPLHRCLFYGKIHIAIELIKLGANINLLDDDNLTAFEHLMKDGCVPDDHDDCGEIFYWGTNVNNILGPKESRTIPESLDIFHKNYPNQLVKEIRIERFHCVILTDTNRLYSCGHGHGGRLGLGHQKTTITPELIKLPDDSLNCCQIAIAQDHSLFLCQDNYVYTCGLNTYKQLGTNQQQSLKPTLIKQFPNNIEGVCCGHYHSCVWGGNFLYTWGLNGGQLGHKNRTEKYIQHPELVNIINFNDLDIKQVNCSDAAISIYTGKGDIYILHEYQCRKIASKQLNLIQIDIIGGKLNQKLFNKDDTVFNNIELKVIVLTNTGNLLLWQENDQQLLRCIYSINRTIIVKQIKLNLNGLLFVTRDGEAFQGFIKPRKRKTTTNTQDGGSFHKFLDRDDCISIKIRKFPRLHRCLQIQSDQKGNDFCVIQTSPYKRFKAPKIIESEIESNFQALLDECEENDDICDVIFQIKQHVFIPAHRFVVATKCGYFEKLFNQHHEKLVKLDNSVNASIFNEFLSYIYTGDCDLLRGKLSDDLKSLCETTTTITTKPEEDHNVSAFAAYNHHNNNKNHFKNSKPARMLYEMSKTFGCSTLCDRLKHLELKKSTSRSNSDRFDRGKSQYCDVLIKCSDHKEIKAHKCVLSARSDYFKNLFSMRWHGSETSTITLPYTKQIIDGLLEYLYTDDIKFVNNLDRDQDYLFKLLILADQLFILRLKELCEFYLYECLTLKNVVQYLNFSHIYNAEKLKQCCLQFIIDNLPPLLELHQFDHLDDDLLQQLTDFYCDKKPKIACRIITPYSTAPSDSIILAISSTYPVSIDEDGSSSSSITTNKTQKRRSRQHKTSNTSVNVQIEEDNDDDRERDEEEEIQFPDSLPPASSPSSLRTVNRLKAIRLAEEALENHHHAQFTILNSSNHHHNHNNNRNRDCDSTISGSFEDFPLLNSPPKSTNSTPRPQRISNNNNNKIVRISQKQRKRLSSESHEIVAIPESPKNPWKIIEPTSPSSLENSFNEIVSLEKKQKENLVKITSKSLIYTQIEDRAIEELEKFYNVSNIFEEDIMIERVSLGAIAVPVWVPGVKRHD